MEPRTKKPAVPCWFNFDPYPLVSQLGQHPPFELSDVLGLQCRALGHWRSICEVRPAVEGNLEKIQQAVNQLQEQLKKKTEQRTEFIKKYNLNHQKAASSETEATSNKGGGSVLV
ncbi:unnamed protein product [Effrenium voratum]|uniref:Uncharacterized protein n=1 Tax=Effrenium voratum TaxID=2562239 RepID=A0AA36JR52_9DINO|nr:unnamed protein product [Effrenium voratum]CAJ1410250.1 unnamed protein product [Effrenium voratum]CAJ1445333.1 unnamed protein product [Effrenium voratum]